MPPDPRTVIATANTVNDAFNRAESAGAMDKLDKKMHRAEVASMLGLIASVRDSIENAQDEVGEGRMACPHSDDPFARQAAVLLSRLSDGDGGTLSTAPTPDGHALEAKFDTNDWLGWLSVGVEKLKHWKRTQINRPPVEISNMPDRGRVAVLGDWGTNLYGAPKCRESIERDPKALSMILHLGDVYYSGTRKEVSERFLNVWPKRKDPKLLHRALNSNHEMYSGGDAYFRITLPAFRQSASYFALANDHWLMVGLDTAYGRASAMEDHDIDDQQLAWINGILNHSLARKKKVLFLSHHQLFSRFESQGDNLAARLSPLLDSGRVNAWIWGHEHRCVVYSSHPQFGGLKASCIGHGGMPDVRSQKVTALDLEQTIQTASGEMLWRRFEALPGEGRQICPSGLVLDGENRYVEGDEDRFSPHGYAILRFEDKDLVEEIYTPDGSKIHERNLA